MHTPVAEPSIAASVEATPTGIYLAAALATLDIHALDGADRVAVLRAHQRMASHHAAKMYEAMGAIADVISEDGDHAFDEAFEGATAEVRVALTLTRRAADTEFAFAHHLRTRLPQVAAMLEDGRIDVRRAKAIDHATGHLTAGNAQYVVSRLAEAIPHLTTGQITVRVRKLRIAVDPESAVARYTAAVRDRRLVLEPTVDGTADLHILDLPPDRAAAIRSRIQRMATSLHTRGETRTMDQLRADVAVDVLLGRTDSLTEAPRSGSVSLTVDLDTLIGLVDHPGNLDGYGPVISDIARQIGDESAAAEWRFTVTDTETNEPIATGRTRRRPNRKLRRSVTDPGTTCVFPGCRMPAMDCDVDHIEAWSDGGSTEPANLAPLCRHDHRLKHKYGWRYRRDYEGRHIWTTALGQTVVNPREPP